MNRTDSAKTNIMFGLLSKILTMIMEFISRTIFIRFLGTELLGVNGVFTNIIQVLSLAELGMNNVVMYSFYKPMAENNRYRVAALIRFYRKIYNSIAIAVAIIGLAIIPFLDKLINSKINIPNITLIYLLFLSDTVFSYLYVYKITLLRSDQKNYIVTKYEISMTTIRNILQIVSMIIFKNFIIYLAIKVIMSILTNFIMAKRAENDYRFINQKADLSNPDKNDIINVVKSGFIYKIATVFLNSTDNILISIMVGTIWVGYLSNYVTLITSLSAFIFIIFNNITASVGNLVVMENENKRLEIFNVMLFVGSWIAIVFTSCMWILCDDFITLWLGREYLMEKGVVISKIIMLYISCILNPIFSYREALGLYQKTKYAMVLAGIINIGLSILLGKYWGITGILVASIIAILVTYFWYEPFVLYRDYFGRSSNEYFRKLISNFVIGFVGLCGLQFISKYISATNWITWLIKAALMFILINLYCYLSYRNRWEFKFLKNKIIKK
ncbi:lipopolysaccharide biosynthesis protein [Clostridium tertium]